MVIEKNQLGLLVKINTPANINFHEEHMDLIEKNGFIWVCKFGHSNLKLNNLSSLNLLVMVDSNLNKKNSYVLNYIEVTDTLTDKDIYYPAYYDSIPLNKSVFFKVTEIKKIDYNELNDNFFVTSTKNSIDNVRKSICPHFFITSKYDLKL